MIIIPMPETFVILIHSGHGREHHDLMLADGDSLATWQLPRSPVDLAVGEPVPAVRLAAHRTAYLDYEGPVSGGRGRVDRLDRGGYERLEAGEACWLVRLHGHRLQGLFELRRTDPQTDRWTLRRLEEGGARRSSDV